MQGRKVSLALSNSLQLFEASVSAKIQNCKQKVKRGAAAKLQLVVSSPHLLRMSINAKDVTSDPEPAPTGGIQPIMERLLVTNSATPLPFIMQSEPKLSFLFLLLQLSKPRGPPLALHRPALLS